MLRYQIDSHCNLSQRNDQFSHPFAAVLVNSTADVCLTCYCSHGFWMTLKNTLHSLDDRYSWVQNSLFSPLIFKLLKINHTFSVVSWLRRLVAGLSPRGSMFAPGPVHVSEICGRQSGTGTDFFPSSSVSPVVIFPPWLSLPIYHLRDEKQAHWRPKFGDIVSPHRHE
jgi:hypothetical protein